LPPHWTARPGGAQYYRRGDDAASHRRPRHHDSTAATAPVPDFTAHLGDGVRRLRIGLSPITFRIHFSQPGSGEFDQQAITAEIETSVRYAAEKLAG